RVRSCVLRTLRSNTLRVPRFDSESFRSHARTFGTQSGLTIARKVSNGRSPAPDSQEVRFSMNAKAILIGLLLIATAGMAVLVTPAARAATLINGELVQETGPTTALGGGDHVFVRLGSDAAFGVV